MSKNILQDIKPLTSSNKRRIHESINYEDTSNTENISTSSKQPKIIMPKYDNEEHPKRRKGFLLLMVIVLVVIGLISSLLYYFGKITIIIKAESSPIELADVAITAYTTPKEDELPFEVMIVPAEESTTIEATEKTKVERQAKGRVVLYNEYSSSSQNLKIDTRLETSDGLIYKTDKAVIIPGTTTKNGTITPGQIEVGIYAEKAGTNYNSDKEIELKIFGFKGTAKANKFYAKSKGAITGGQSGEMYTISPTDARIARDGLNDKLKAKLKESAKVQVPPGFIYFENGTNYEIESDNNSPIDSIEKNVLIKKSGKLSVVLFNEKKLVQYLAKTNISQFEDGDVYIPELGTFTFAFKDNDNLLLKDAKEISFKLTGSGNIIYNVDKDAVLNALKNKKKSEFKSVFGTFPSIDFAEIKMSPFWRNKFPDNTKDVVVIVN